MLMTFMVRFLLLSSANDTSAPDPPRVAGLEAQRNIEIPPLAYGQSAPFDKGEILLSLNTSWC